ncbi:hypothetical protein ACFY0G_34625 [Streptomyces sp. NPDC001552]|uniref:hypothetical protein n=1 Tax=Streptomyces sp. NPDC001552 TaxID=3364587 RepID=UPI00367964E0
MYALAGLADDAPTRDLRQTCIDVLCAYLRLPYTAELDLPSGDADARHLYLFLREVRHTVIRLIRDHLRVFGGVVFDGGRFGGAMFSGGTVRFGRAVFSRRTVSFDGAVSPAAR